MAILNLADVLPWHLLVRPGPRAEFAPPLQRGRIHRRGHRWFDAGEPFNSGEVRMDTYSHGVPGVNAFYRIKITHVPSGLSVSGSGESGLALRRLLMEQLTEKVRGLKP